jgi:hypothetical protein
MSVFTKSVEAHPGVYKTAGSTVAAQQAEVLAKQNQKFLNRAHPPARLSASDAAELLGFHEDDMSILVREKLLSPLGNPSHNSVKYFALVEVIALGGDVGRLSVATEAIYQRNKSKGKGDKVNLV